MKEGVSPGVQERLWWDSTPWNVEHFRGKEGMGGRGAGRQDPGAILCFEHCVSSGVCGSFWESFGVRLAPFSLVVGTIS